jgi:hypothetical protein
VKRLLTRFVSVSLGWEGVKIAFETRCIIHSKIIKGLNPFAVINVNRLSRVKELISREILLLMIADTDFSSRHFGWNLATDRHLVELTLEFVDGIVRRRRRPPTMTTVTAAA